MGCRRPARPARQGRARRKAIHCALQLRIGIDIEDVIDEDGILQGDGVNIASRIHQAAEPGQIVVTATVRDYVINRLPVVFHDLGTPPMKNINRPIRVFAVEWTEEKKSDLIVQPYLQWSSRPTVAVLPFRTIGGIEDDRYFGDGITDEIISGLSRSRGLYVIARNSTLRYRDRRNRPASDRQRSRCPLYPRWDRAAAEGTTQDQLRTD